jgi:hypothetical protein
MLNLFHFIGEKLLNQFDNYIHRAAYSNRRKR